MEQELEKNRSGYSDYTPEPDSQTLDILNCFALTGGSIQFGLWGTQQTDEATQEQIFSEAGVRDKLRSGKSAHSLGQLVAFRFQHCDSLGRSYAGG